MIAICIIEKPAPLHRKINESRHQFQFNFKIIFFGNTYIYKKNTNYKFKLIKVFAGGLRKTKKCFELKSLTVITVNQG